MNKKQLFNKIMLNVAILVKKVLNEEYIENNFLTNKDKEDLWDAFEICGYEECDFIKTIGHPFTLNSFYNGEEVSIDIISCNLACQLSNGETVKLEDIISDRGDIKKLVKAITNYTEF